MGKIAPGRACGCRADGEPGRAVSGVGGRAGGDAGRGRRRVAAGDARPLAPPCGPAAPHPQVVADVARLSARVCRGDAVGPATRCVQPWLGGRAPKYQRPRQWLRDEGWWGAACWAGEKGAPRGCLRARPPRLLFAELLREESAPRSAALATRAPLSRRPAPPGGLRMRLSGIPSVQLFWAGALPAGRSKGLL